MAAAAAVDYVLFEGTRLPFAAKSHLRTLDRLRLHEHAQMIYRTLGSRHEILAPELYQGDLADWILQVQGRHLEPLQVAAEPRELDAGQRRLAQVQIASYERAGKILSEP